MTYQAGTVTITDHTVTEVFTCTAPVDLAFMFNGQGYYEYVLYSNPAAALDSGFLVSSGPGLPNPGASFWQNFKGSLYASIKTGQGASSDTFTFTAWNAS